MRALREQDFDQMAERVVDRFMNGDKLADAATDEAMGGELNPDQIARMVQAANTQAFLRLMDQQKAQGVPDMTNEFDPIDARQVIQQIVGQTSPHMEGHDTPSGMSPHGDFGDRSGMQPGDPDPDLGPLPDEMQGMHPAECVDPPGAGGPEPHDSMCVDKDDDNDGPFPKGEKQKAKDDKDKPKKKAPPKSPEKDEPKEAAFRDRRFHKLAAVLEDQFKQAEWAFEDVFANLGQQLRRAHGAPSPTAFEKDALALHGHEVGIVVLNMVKESQGLAPISFEDAQTKTAALVDRHLVEDTETNRTFAALVKIAVEANRLRMGAAHARAQCS
jgi:hypothetical protein